jgi:hypothetical protein
VGGHYGDPQTLNRFAYVRNGPLRLTDPTGLDFYLRCTQDSDTCQDNRVGTTDENGNFTPTVITSDSIRAGENSAVVDENGVEITTGGQTYQGEYFDNPASHATDEEGNDVNNNPIDLNGAPNSALRDFSFHVNASDPANGNLASGTATYHGSGSFAWLTLELVARGAFAYPTENELGPLHPKHPNALNFRFSSGAAPIIFNYGPSVHLVIPIDSRLTVPGPASSFPFHVDSATGMAHGVCAYFHSGC